MSTVEEIVNAAKSLPPEQITHHVKSNYRTLRDGTLAD